MLSLSRREVSMRQNNTSHCTMCSGTKQFQVAKPTKARGCTKCNHTKMLAWKQHPMGWKQRYTEGVLCRRGPQFHTGGDRSVQRTMYDECIYEWIGVKAEEGSTLRHGYRLASDWIAGQSTVSSKEDVRRGAPKHKCIKKAVGY